MVEKEKKEPKFEEALRRLEQIVEELEGGELSLEEALKQYEEGVTLSKLCARRLEEAKKKIELLMKENGKLFTKTLREEDLEEEGH